MKTITMAVLPVSVLLAFSGLAMGQQSPSTYLLFPHFAAGGGITSEITLLNPTGRDVSAYFRAYDQNGIETGDMIDTYFTVIPSHGTKIVPVNANINDPVRVGWINIGTGPNGADSVLIGILKITIPGIGTSSVEPGTTGSTFALPASKGLSGSTAIAVMNDCLNPVTVQVQLRNSDGLSIGSRNITLPRFGQFAKYIDELIAVSQNSYSGLSVSVTTIIPQNPAPNCRDISVVSFDLGSQPGQFIVQPVGKVN